MTTNTNKLPSWTWDKVGDSWVSVNHDGMTYRVFADKFPNPIRWHFQAWEPFRPSDEYAVDTALIINHPGYWHEHSAFMAAEQWAIDRTFSPERFRAAEPPAPEPDTSGAGAERIAQIIAQIEARHRAIADRINWRWSNDNMAHARMLVCDIEALGNLHMFPVLLIAPEDPTTSIVPDNGDTDIDEFIAHSRDDIGYLLSRLRTVTAERDAARAELATSEMNAASWQAEAEMLRAERNALTDGPESDT